MSWVSQALAILGLLLMAEAVLFFIPIFFAMIVITVYLMMTPRLVRLFEWILQPYLLYEQRDASSQTLFRKFKIKRKLNFKKCIMSTNWDGCIQKRKLHSKVSSACLSLKEEMHVQNQKGVLILGVVSKILKTFDKVITTADKVRSQIMSYWKRLLATQTPITFTRT